MNKGLSSNHDDEPRLARPKSSSFSLPSTIPRTFTTTRLSPSMAEPIPDEASAILMNSLHRTLNSLLQNPYPTVENPPSCKKRASVALILRIRPHFNHPSPAPDTVPSENSEPQDAAARLSDFFAQPWVQAGDPEVVFIKRAARVGDRWTSHVALPGGKRDPEDADDGATAIRETSEEIGLDLTDESVVRVGNLPERVVKTSWGKVPYVVPKYNGKTVETNVTAE